MLMPTACSICIECAVGNLLRLSLVIYREVIFTVQLIWLILAVDFAYSS